MPVRDVVVLGSTGSIGTQALEVIAAYPERFRVVGLAAGGKDIELLAQQAIRHQVPVVAVAKEAAAEGLRAALAKHTGLGKQPTVLADPEAVTDIAQLPADVVLNAITGSIGLASTLAALQAGRTVALANKESLVAGGSLVRQYAKPGQLIPVDSEHSALAQALRAGNDNEVARLILTASGGPFRDTPVSELDDVTPAQALVHPTWNMGPVVTINSATLVNKGLELIEAHELFHAQYGIGYDDIDVVIHPQSVVHSLVEFCDGSTIAQVSTPDMRLPIGLALAWPHRLPASEHEAEGAARSFAVPWENSHTWRFMPLDNTAFPAVELARDTGRAGGCLPAVFNAANEECVAAFLAGALRFPAIVATVRAVVEAADKHWHEPPGSVADVIAAEQWARTTARQMIEVS